MEGTHRVRIWRWVTGRIKTPPRRVTIAIWVLLWLFSPGIDRLARRYQRQIYVVNVWALIIMTALGAMLLAWIWHSGRDARRRRRARMTTRQGAP